MQEFHHLDIIRWFKFQYNESIEQILKFTNGTIPWAWYEEYISFQVLTIEYHKPGW